MHNERGGGLAYGDPFVQTAREVDDAKDQNETDSTLRDFGRCAVALRNVLDENRPLNNMGLLFIENHFHAVQMAYLRWKWKHRPLPTEE